MASTKKKWIVRVVLLVIAIGAVYVWNSLPSPRQWERGFEQLAEGDHISKVIEVLGQPTQINGCNPARFSHDPELRKRCIKEYFYISFLEEWVYVVDQDGIVIAKWHSVSQ